MRNFIERLAKQLDESGHSLVREEYSRENICRRFAEESGDHFEDALIRFEKIEAQLHRNGVRFNSVRGTYDVFSRTLTLEKLPSPDALARYVEISNDQLRETLRVRLLGFAGQQFQRAAVEILRLIPWVKAISSPKLTRDGGLDFKATVSFPPGKELRAIGQIKKSKHPVVEKEIRDFLGSRTLAKPRPDVGVFISFSGYTPDARRAAAKAEFHIDLHDLDDMLDWMEEHSIGIQRQQQELLSMNSTFWEEVG